MVHKGDDRAWRLIMKELRHTERGYQSLGALTESTGLPEAQVRRLVRQMGSSGEVVTTRRGSALLSVWRDEMRARGVSPRL
jgi:DNA-binding IclR family transcriptional regulator